MAKTVKEGERDWRSLLSPDEAEELQKIEAETRAIDRRRRDLTAQRRLIRDRGAKRWVASQKRDAQPELIQTTGQKVDSSRQREACE